ncbi:MAG: excalibur calcium-binding domain-containing protein [Rhizomicrobium sp.]
MPDNVIPFRRPVRKADAPKPKLPSPKRPRQPGRWPPASIAFIACVAAFLVIKTFSPWPVGLTLRHFAAATGCPTARFVGLAPAHIGDAGYWSHLDSDRHGVSCSST